MWNKRKFKLQALKKMEEKTPRVEEYERIEESSKKRMSSKKKWGLIGGGLSFAAVLAVTISLVTIRPWENKDDYFFAKEEVDYCARMIFNEATVGLKDIEAVTVKSDGYEFEKNNQHSTSYCSYSIYDAVLFNTVFDAKPTADFPVEAVGAEFQGIFCVLNLYKSQDDPEDQYAQIGLLIFRYNDFVFSLLQFSGRPYNVYGLSRFGETMFLHCPMPESFESCNFSDASGIGLHRIISTKNVFETSFASADLSRDNGKFSLKWYYNEKSPNGEHHLINASISNANHLDFSASFDVRWNNDQRNAEAIATAEHPSEVHGDYTLYTISITCSNYPWVVMICYDAAYSLKDAFYGVLTPVKVKVGDKIRFALDYPEEPDMGSGFDGIVELPSEIFVY